MCSWNQLVSVRAGMRATTTRPRDASFLHFSIHPMPLFFVLFSFEYGGFTKTGSPSSNGHSHSRPPDPPMGHGSNNENPYLPPCSSSSLALRSGGVAQSSVFERVM